MSLYFEYKRANQDASQDSLTLHDSDLNYPHIESKIKQAAEYAYKVMETSKIMVDDHISKLSKAAELSPENALICAHKLSRSLEHIYVEHKKALSYHSDLVLMYRVLGRNDKDEADMLYLCPGKDEYLDIKEDKYLKERFNQSERRERFQKLNKKEFDKEVEMIEREEKFSQASLLTHEKTKIAITERQKNLSRIEVECVGFDEDMNLHVVSYVHRNKKLLDDQLRVLQVYIDYENKKLLEIQDIKLDLFYAGRFSLKCV